MMLPEYCELPMWAASLFTDFPTDNIQILLSEENWQEWGNFLIQEPSFAINDAPRTDGYADWKSWAKDLFYTMSNNQ